MFDSVHNWLWWICVILYVPACLGLIAVVLLQKGKGVGFAGAFGLGGGGADTVFGPRMSKSLPVKITYVMAGMFLVLALTMFFGTVVSGTQAMVAVLIPIAFAAPTAGLPLLTLLMCMNYAAAQVSPMHICLSVITEHNKTTLGALVRKTVPVIGTFMLIAVGYYYLLRAVL